MADGARDLEFASGENTSYDEWGDDNDDDILASILDYPCDNKVSRTVNNFEFGPARNDSKKSFKNEDKTESDSEPKDNIDNKENAPKNNNNMSESTQKTEESSFVILTNEKSCAPKQNENFTSIDTQKHKEPPTSKDIQSKGSLAISVGSSQNREFSLNYFRPMYLCVTDLTKQHWCEQQLWYSFTVPTIQVEDPVVSAGSSIHLARELAVHDIVPVETTSREDSWAIKLLNLLGAVQGFLNGVNLAREIPIFGAPFGQDSFLVGLIDELRFDPESYTIELSELKTRSVQSVPKKAQQEQNRLQVMIYKKLFDDLVKGQLKKEVLAHHLKLELDKPLGASVLDQFDLKFTTAKNLNELADYVFERMQALTCISELTVEYVHQKTSTSLMKIPVEYNEEELRGMFCGYLEFWRGSREPVGVDIEDAWKCQWCDFADICEWRERKAQEHANKNKTKSLIL